MDIIMDKHGNVKTNETGTPVEGGIPAGAAMVLTDPAQGNAIVYDGDKWVCGDGGGGGAEALNDLSDVAISSAANKQALVYESSSSKWKNKALALADMSDVAISGATEGDVLTYNSDAEKWVNAPVMRMYDLHEETVDDDTFLSLGGEYALDSTVFTNNLCWLVVDGSYYGIAQIDLPEDGDQTVTFNNGDSYTLDTETGYWVKNAAT